MPSGTSGKCFLCHEETPRQCENCDLFMCSDYCQSKHRYNDTCLPFKVENSPEIGRYVVATRDILATELIISEEAAALGPCPNTLPRCLTCLASLGADTAVSCDKCNFPFCSQACSESDVHVNNECAVFPYRLPDISDYEHASPQYDCITSLRLLLNKETNPALWKHLMLHRDHTEDRKQAYESQVEREQKVVVGFLLDWAGLRGSGYTEAEVNTVTSLLSTHSVRFNEVGRAMYPTFAFMSHSCNYNSRHVIHDSVQDVQDSRMEVYAQKMIKKGEEITITYTSLLTFAPDKKEKICNTWHFTCSCERCSDPSELGSFTSSVCCPGCPKKGFLLPCLEVEKEEEVKEEKLKEEPLKFDCDDEDSDDLDDLLDDLELNPVLFKKQEDPKIKEVTGRGEEEETEAEDSSPGSLKWGCADCKMILPGEKVAELLTKTQASMPGVACTEVARHEAWLAATVAMLHPHNYQAVVTKRILSQLYGRGPGGCEALTDAELLRKMSLCRELLHYISFIDAGYSQFRGLTTWELFQAKECYIKRKYSEERQMESREELLDLLKIVILSLKMENKSSPSLRIKDKAVSKYLQISNRDDVDVTTNDIINLYSKMSDQDRNNVRVFLDIEVDGEYLGKIVLHLRYDIVPRTCENFLCMCTGERGMGFKDTVFHRIIPGFMCQGGDITASDGTGSVSIYGETFGDENFKLMHDGPGILSMANSGPDTNGSQFFICTEKTPWLDGKHVVFGRVVSGMEVVRRMEQCGSYTGDVSKVVKIRDCGEFLE